MQNQLIRPSIYDKQKTAETYKNQRRNNVHHVIINAVFRSGCNKIIMF